MPPHAANPLDTELYTAAVCRARSPDCAVHSNASVNEQLLLHQHAGETCDGWAWYTDVMSLMATLTFRVTPVTSDEPQQTLQLERAAGRGSDGWVHSRDASDRYCSNWQQAAARATQLAAETDMLPGIFTDTDNDHGLVRWNGEISSAVYMGRSLYHLARARCEGGDLMR